MEILKKYLCDWGSADSNMLLFFMLTSFLLGLLTGWLIWGRKIQAMANLMAEKDATIADINTKFTAKEADFNKVSAELEASKLKIREHEEEKGQLRSDLISTQVELDKIQAKITGLGTATATSAIAAAMPMMAAEAPSVETTQEVAVEEVAKSEVNNNDSIADDTNGKEAEQPVSAAVSTKDDLKIVEGIGPKIEELCNNIGIFTWNQLASTPVSRLQEMLNEAGKRYQIHNPGTWPEQAKMAAEGAWEQLKVYQDHLKGGKEPE